MATGTVGLQTHIWNNNLRSLMLLAFYPLIIIAMVWAVAFVSVYATAENYATYTNPAHRIALKGASETIFVWWPTIVTVVGVWFTIAWFFNGKMMRMMSRARPVTRKEEPELYNLLENLSITAGVTMPRLEIIETHARNAYASGLTEKTFTVTVTRGLLRSLTRDEIEAVLAHELTHILNRDVRLLIVSVIFCGMIGFAAQMTWNVVRYRLWFGGGNRRGGGRAVLVILAVIAILWIGYLATTLTRFALSRRREYMADAGAIELTKKPEAMMGALMRIARRDKIPEATDDVALMCIQNSRKFMGLFATHPPIDRRINSIAETTNTPVPDLRAGARAANEERFQRPATDKSPNPWLTRERRR